MKRLLLAVALVLLLVAATVGPVSAQGSSAPRACWGDYISGQASAQGGEFGAYVSGNARALGRGVGELVSSIARTCDFPEVPE